MKKIKKFLKRAFLIFYWHWIWGVYVIRDITYCAFGAIRSAFGHLKCPKVQKVVI